MPGVIVLVFVLLCFNGSSFPIEEREMYMDAYWSPSS